jgi:arylsulfatase A-like enzyme
MLNRWVICICFSLCVIHIEWLRAYRWNFWMPPSLEHWTASAIVALVFASILFAVSTATGAALRNKALAPIFEVVVAGLVSAMFWVGLLRQWDGLRIHPVLYIAGSAGIVWLMLLLAARGKLFDRRRTPFALAVGLLSTICAIDAVAYYSFFDQELRQSLLPITTAAWFVVAACIAGVVGSKWGENRRRFWWLRALLIIVLLSPIGLRLIVAPKSARAEADRPNVLIIVCDALRADRTSLYGGPIDTPNFERVAEAGVRYSWAYSLAPWTVPSMLGIFSSNYPPALSTEASRAEHLAEMQYYALPQSAPTLANQLMASGYVNCAVTGNWLVERAGLLRNFHHTGVFPVTFGSERWGKLSYLPFTQDMLAVWFPKLWTVRAVDTSRVINSYAEEFLRRNIDRPHFLYMHYMAPHDPYDPPDSFRSRQGPWNFVGPSRPDLVGPHFDGEWRLDLSEDERSYTRSLYDDHIRYVDSRVGEILDLYERAGLLDNTVVCITSDHGEEFWEHGNCYHGQSMYNELVHVPLVISAPDVQTKTIDSPVSHIDVMPTLAELAGLKAPLEWNGQSHAAALRGETDMEERPVFARSTYLNAPEPMVMIVDDDLKLIWKPASDLFELYDLANDPGELQNIAARRAGDVARLVGPLQEWAEQFPADPRDWSRGDRAASDTEEMLRAVGYLE